MNLKFYLIIIYDIYICYFIIKNHIKSIKLNDKLNS